MFRTITIYGLISGAVAGLGIIVTIVTSAQHSLFLGYLIMLVALSSILVGVKQYRDQRLGGVIGLLPGAARWGSASRSWRGSPMSPCGRSISR